MFIVSPSLLAADFTRLGEELEKVRKAGAAYIHLDVMDGIFVPNISFGPPVISSLRKVSPLIFDVHLMITDPKRYIDAFLKAGADIITIHFESCENPLEVISYIRSREARAGISIKPATPVSAIHHLIPEVDMVLIMTVEPGFGGQKLIHETVPQNPRTQTVRSLSRSLPTDIQVDGGVTPKTCTYLPRRARTSSSPAPPFSATPSRAA
jgi:ribulose-phosphate 3-epimerase